MILVRNTLIIQALYICPLLIKEPPSLVLLSGSDYNTVAESGVPAYSDVLKMNFRA